MTEHAGPRQALRVLASDVVPVDLPNLCFHLIFLSVH